MQVIVLSSGRSGTNIYLEALSKADELTLDDKLENKDIFNMIGSKYIDGYLCKSDTVYTRSWIFVALLMQNNPGMNIVWTIRHPYDWALSKINRGQKETGISDDATLFGCIGDLYKAADIHRRLIGFYSKRVFTYSMENLLLYPKDILQNLCSNLGIQYKDEMDLFYKDMKCKEKSDRYSTVDLSQIGMYKNPEYVNAVEKKSGINADLLFNLLQPLVNYYRY